MPNTLWKIRDFLAEQAEKPHQYNLIQRFFGSQKMWENFVSLYIAQDAPEYILDIGCGTAEIIPYLAPGISYVGIDSNSRYIASCRKRYPEQLFILGDWSSLSQRIFRPPELILCLGLLHHLDSNSARILLRECYEVLQKGGKIISLDGAKQDDCGRFEAIFYQADRGRFIRGLQGYASLFPQQPETSLHKNWLRVPYRYAVCELIKR